MRATVRYLPIFLLVVVLLLLDVVAFWASRANGDLTASFAISQTCLLGIWIGIGNTRIAIRLPVAVCRIGGVDSNGLPLSRGSNFDRPLPRFDHWMDRYRCRRHPHSRINSVGPFR